MLWTSNHNSTSVTDACGGHVFCRDTCTVLLQALPASLRVLQAFRVPLDVLAQLTALESLTLEDSVSNVTGAACSLSVLQRLTRLQWGCAKHAELDLITACSGLRTLCIRST